MYQKFIFSKLKRRNIMYVQICRQGYVLCEKEALDSYNPLIHHILQAQIINNSYLFYLL